MVFIRWDHKAAVRCTTAHEASTKLMRLNKLLSAAVIAEFHFLCQYWTTTSTSADKDIALINRCIPTYVYPEQTIRFYYSNVHKARANSSQDSSRCSWAELKYHSIDMKQIWVIESLRLLITSRQPHGENAKNLPTFLKMKYAFISLNQPELQWPDLCFICTAFVFVSLSHNPVLSPAR